MKNERNCYNCFWCGDGEEIADEGYCWRHSGEPFTQPDLDVGCDEWEPKEEDDED